MVIRDKIGRYQIQEKLGQGGMGMVFRAYDPMLHRPVAIKVINPALAADETFIHRFQLEARAAASMDHPHVVAVHDADYTDGFYYLVMEYISHGSLAGLIQKEAPLSIERTLAIIEQVASALDYAHARQMVHRDIKPNNIIFDDEGKAHVADFGLVKTAEISLTQDGQTFGTPGYMAPEQIQAAEVGPFTDVYALGVVVYEMLTGRLPFEGSMLTIWEGHVRHQPPPPREFNAALPPKIQEVVLKALEKEPAARYQTAGAFARALREAAAATERDASDRTIVEPVPDSSPTIIEADVPSKGDHTDKRHPSAAGAQVGDAPGTIIETQDRTRHEPETEKDVLDQPVPAYEAEHGADKPGKPVWVKAAFLAGGLLSVALLACVGLAVLGARSNNASASEPNAAAAASLMAEISAQVGDLASGAAYSGYAPTVDSTGQLQVSLPREWGEMRTTPWVMGGEEVGTSLAAAPDLASFYSTEEEPGVYIAASAPLAGRTSVEQLVEATNLSAMCSRTGLKPYEAEGYSGVYDLWTDCTSGAAFFVMAVLDEDASSIGLVQSRLVSSADLDALQHILASLQVKP